MRALFLALTLFSCSYTPKTTIQGSVFCMPFQLEIVGRVDKHSLTQEIHSIFHQVNIELNHFNPDSIISKFNQIEEGQAVPISPLIYDLLIEARELYILTQGRFDPTYSNFNMIKITQKEIVKLSKGVKLDLNAQAKGKALDLIAKKLKELRINNYIINWAGEIITANECQSKTIQIKGSTHKIQLKQGALATSGGRELAKNGLTHFIDTTFSKPIKLEDVLYESITVLSDSGSLSDALATCAFLYRDNHSLFTWIQEIQRKKQCRFYLLKKDKTMIVK